MNINKFRFLLTALAVIVFPAVATAQYKVDSDKPEIVKILEPNTGTDLANKNFRQKDWVEFELKFKIEAKDKKKIFADRVDIKWYVAVKDPDKKGKFLLLEKNITHVNVPIGEDVYSSVYLSPNSIKRITGSEKVSSSDYPQVGGLITVDGQQPLDSSKGLFTLNNKNQWWSNLTASNKIPLLNKNETPYKNLWFSRYAELEQER